MKALSIERNDLHSYKYAHQTKKENIVFIIQGLVRGGAEFFLINLVNRLLTKDIQPIVIVLSKDIPMLHEIDPAIKTYTLSRKFKYDLSISKRIAKIVYDVDAHKVFCVGTFCFFLAKLGMLLRPDIKFYLSLHSTVPLSFKEQVFDTFYLKLMRRIDETIFICHSQKTYYAEKFHHKPVKTTVIYNGIDTNFSYPMNSSELTETRERIRQELGISEQAKIILKVANIRKEKGHLYAINALNVLHKHYDTEAHIIFVGWCPDEYYQELKERAAQHDLINSVHFVGPRTDVRPYLAAADVFTLTSYSVETFSIAALEAMSFGIPCSLTEIGGASEMIEPHKTGLLSIPKNETSIAKTWHELLTKQYDRDYIRHYVKSRFSSENTATEYHKVLKDF